MVIIETFNGELTDVIVKEATLVANNGFKRTEKNWMSEEEVRDHLISDKLYLVKDDDILKGFASFSYLGDILYLEGIVIDPCLQGHNCFYKIMEKEFSVVDSLYFSLRTQNPVMFSAAKRLMEKEFLSDVYSDIKIVPDDVIEKLNIVKKHLNMESEGFINRGTYGNSLYGSGEYKYYGKTMNELFKAYDFASEKGDSVTFVGKVKIK